MKKQFVISFVAALLGVIGCILLMGANPWSFFGPSAMAVVLFSAVFLLRTHYSFAEMGHAFRCAGRRFEASREELLVAHAFFKSARATFLGTGLLGLVMGFIRVLEGANQASYQPGDALTGFSVALITIFYGLFMAIFVIGPFAGAIDKKLAQNMVSNREN
jgi:flagellar motor component MotA